MPIVTTANIFINIKQRPAITRAAGLVANVPGTAGLTLGVNLL